MIAISHAHAAKPQRKVDRASHPEDTVIDLGGGVKIGGGHFQVIAGPCSVEGDNLLTIAARCKAAGATLLRGGAYKPRTSPTTIRAWASAGSTSCSRHAPKRACRS